MRRDRSHRHECPHLVRSVGRSYQACARPAKPLENLGFASRKMNNVLFERFRKTCDEFFARKAEYFKSVKERMAANLEKKKAPLRESRGSQRQYRLESHDRYLRRLAERVEDDRAGGQETLRCHLETLRVGLRLFLCSEKQPVGFYPSGRAGESRKETRDYRPVESHRRVGRADEAIKTVRELMAQWNTIGYVPFKEKDKIYKEYQAQLDILFAR